jgi:hypothetical protein
VVLQLLQDIQGNNLSTIRGVAIFLRLEQGKEATAYQEQPIKNLLMGIQNGEHDEAFFMWSKLGNTRVELTKGSADPYLSKALKPMLGMSSANKHKHLFFMLYFCL